MSRLAATLFMSLDGVVESPEKWSFPYWNDEIVRHQRPDESGRAVDDDVLAGLLLQLRDLGGNITPDQVRVVPF